MPRASRRAKPTKNTDANSGRSSPSLFPLIPFTTGPSLECIPEDVLHEILSHLLALNDFYVLFGSHQRAPVIPSHMLVRTPTLRALSKTSRLLRSRCLAMAWERLELCGASLPKYEITFWKVIGEGIMNAARVLKACPHLLPLIQTVSMCLTRYKSDEVIPALSELLASLPKLTTIQVIHANTQMTTAIRDGFEGEQFLTVRKISLPPSAHEIVRCCPNVEEVICCEGDGSTIVGSLVKGGCNQVRIIKGINAPYKRLFKLLPNLEYIGLYRMWMFHDMMQFTRFPLLNTIEMDYHASLDVESKVRDARKILKENKSKARKRVIVTRWHRPDNGEPYVVKEVIDV